jgi:hypothetical protein
VRIDRLWIGSCEGPWPRLCWTGPDLTAPLVLQAGQNDVWIGIVNQAGEGNVFDLPLASAPASQTYESWGLGQVRWESGGAFVDTPTWTQAPAELPWIFRLVGL